MIENETRKLQLTELQILKDVADFCEENDIVYFLYGGTMIGAARHQGFIPWDDDIDIWMDLRNYKKFLKLSKKLPSKYFVQNYKTDRKCCYSWTKVMLNGTTLIHNGMQSYDIHQGIYIDVFMINGIADGKVRRKIQNKALKIKKHLLRKYFAIEVRKEAPKKWVSMIPEFLRRPLISFMEVLSNIDIEKSEKCFGIEYWNISMAKIYNSKDFYPDSRLYLLFEDSKFACPKNYFDFLRITFGDWQKLPPEEQRVNHNNCIIDFHKNYTEYIKSD